MLAAIEKCTSERTGGLPKQITVAVNHQFDVISNIAVEDGIMNGAECCIKYIEYHTQNTTFPAIVWVQFDDTTIGTNHCNKYKYLQHSSIDNEWTPIFAQRRSFIIKDVWVTRIQFPFRHAAARTIHVAQSATFHNIYIDMSTISSPPKHWWQHMHYVALSRVTSLGGLFLKDLNQEKICVSNHVINYVKKAQTEYKLKLSYMPLYTVKGKLKVIYNNARSFKRHYMDVKHDYNIQAADIIFISETQLCATDHTDTYQMQNYQVWWLDQNMTRKPYHGLIAYVSKNIQINNVTMYPGLNIEAIKLVVQLDNKQLHIIGIYNSPHTKQSQLYKTLNELVQDCNNDSIMIIGDFNVNTSPKNDNFLCQHMKMHHNCEQYVKGYTTVLKTMIDLIFANFTPHIVQTVDAYWSDHKLISAVIENM